MYSIILGGFLIISIVYKGPQSPILISKAPRLGFSGLGFRVSGFSGGLGIKSPEMQTAGRLTTT